MMKIVLLSAMLFCAGLVLVPEASAACEPGLEPFCGEPSLVDQVKDIPPDRCYYYPQSHQIRCEWD